MDISIILKNLYSDEPKVLQRGIGLAILALLHEVQNNQHNPVTEVAALQIIALPNMNIVTTPRSPYKAFSPGETIGKTIAVSA